DCGADDLTGETVGVDGLAQAKINALVTIERLDGTRVQTVLGPRTASLVVPARPRRLDVARAYAALGVAHILPRPDHLLFVFGLLLLVSASRLLLQPITASTVGHSLTLSAAVLGIANVPSRPVEVLIAASVLVLAVELARGDERPTMLRRFPWAMAVAFGLLHGFGFAGALAEAGLPAAHVPPARGSVHARLGAGQPAVRRRPPRRG